jgi:hypothetical protein
VRKTLIIFTVKDSYTWNITQYRKYYSLKHEAWVVGISISSKEALGRKACDRRQWQLLFLLLLMFFLIAYEGLHSYTLCAHWNFNFTFPEFICPHAFSLIVHSDFEVSLAETQFYKWFHLWSFWLTSVMIGPAKLAIKTCTSSVVRMISPNKTGVGSKQAKPSHTIFCLNSCRDSKCGIV